MQICHMLVSFCISSSLVLFLFQRPMLQFEFLTATTSPIMGIAESKILLGKLEAACSYAEHNGCNQVQHVLSDKHVSQSYLNFIHGLIKSSLSTVLQNYGSTYLSARRNRLILPAANAPGTPQSPPRNRKFNYLNL